MYTQPIESELLVNKSPHTFIRLNKHTSCIKRSFVHTYGKTGELPTIGVFLYNIHLNDDDKSLYIVKKYDFF